VYFYQSKVKIHVFCFFFILLSNFVHPVEQFSSAAPNVALVGDSSAD